MKAKWALLSLVVLLMVGTVNALTIYPTDDARIIRDGVNETYPTIIAGAGTTISRTLNTTTYLSSNSYDTKYTNNHRYGVTFNGSSIPDDVTITSARIKIFVSYQQTNGLGSPGLVWRGFAPTTAGTLVATDYNKVDNTPYTNTIAYGDLVGETPVYFTLNTEGINNISKTGLFSMAMTQDWDLAGTGPTWASTLTSSIRVPGSWFAGTDYDPYLEVNYTETTPPASITNLNNTTGTTCSTLHFNWTIPADGDYDHVMVYKDGVFLHNLTTPIFMDVWSGLSTGTSYTISTRTVDTVGNVNTTWVNRTISTSSTCPSYPPPMGKLTNAATNLSITTYDGSGQQIHPNVIYTATEWNGYHYLMVETPFAASNASLENPSMRYSNDMVTWESIAGQPDPTIAAPATGNHSDPAIVLKDGTLYLFYRYANTPTLYYNYTTTTDGVTWTTPVTTNLLTSASGSFIYDVNGWEAWGHTSGNLTQHYFANTPATWIQTGTISGIDVGADTQWHSEVKYYDDQYQLLMHVYSDQKEYYFNSTDGLIWVPSESNPVLTARAAAFWDDNLYKSSFIERNGVFDVFYSGYNGTSPTSVHVGYTQYDGSTTGTTTIYPIPLLNETRYLPNSDANLPASGFNISINGTPNNYEAASFIIKPSLSPTDVTITATTLTDADGTGHTAIPTSALDIKVVGVWYQASDRTDGTWYDGTPLYILTPELLLNNKTILRVNRTAQTNEIWIRNATFEGYYHIDNTTINNFPTDALIYDNATAGGFPQPFSLTANENQQIMVTTLIPSSQASGNYTGKLWINSSLTDPIAANISVRVLPFSLQNATLDYGLSYLSSTSTADPAYNINGGTYWKESKSQSRYLADLTNMKNHGVLYPSMCQQWQNHSSYATEYHNYETALTLRNQSGLPRDKLYDNCWAPSNTIYESSNAGVLAELGIHVQEMKTQMSANGWGDQYILGIDESNATGLLLEVPSHTTILNNGSYTWADGTAGVLWSANTIMTVANIAGVPNTTERDQWHSVGKKIYMYAYPQVGVESSEVYRQNFGFALWASGYDGSMAFSYQQRYPTTSTGNIWNDYDYVGGNYREETFTYPATDHPIDTLQWEGYREGVDDTRYADTLSNITGNTTEATTIINDGITAGQDMSVIRAHIIDHILAYGGATIPTASFTKNRYIVKIPQTVIFTDTSTNIPTQWNWSFGDSNWSNGTTQNVTYTYETVGVYSAFLIASNTAGSNQSESQTITVTTPIVATPTSTSASSLCGTAGGIAPLMGIFATILAFGIIIDTILVIAIAGATGESKRLAIIIFVVVTILIGVMLIIMATFVTGSIPTTLACV